MIDETLSLRPGDLDDINTIGFLAQQIWPETYGDILSGEQLQYMLNLFYSPGSLRRQMLDEKHQFLLVEQGEEPIGFAAWSATEEAGIFKLHKLYVLPGRQGKGLGRSMLGFIYQSIQPQGATALRLNVNRFNKAREFYERMGFAVIKEEDVPIGNGYFMNDYVMEAPVPA
ncbi:MAG TPA: GNAT family N-acetyltransferase [Puia sp.]|jgi:GNAT superfamily N-acetyltransferase|nr:GNAT family N-acetyltransferase [Puia sp.]